MFPRRPEFVAPLAATPIGSTGHSKLKELGAVPMSAVVANLAALFHLSSVNEPAKFGVPPPPRILTLVPDAKLVAVAP